MTAPRIGRLSARRYMRIAASALLVVAFALQFTNAAVARPSAVLDEVSHDPFTNRGS